MTAYRRPLAWLLFVALLFAQVANAAHACAPQTSIDASSIAMSDCEAVQTAQADHGFDVSPLCAVHCTHGTQATVDAHVFVPHWFAAPLLGVFLVLPAVDLRFSALAFSEAPGRGRSIAPAIPILLGRFLS